MLVLVGLLVVVALVVAVGALGIGPLVLRDATRPQRTSTGLPLLGLIVGGGGVVLALAALMLGIGFREAGDDADETTAPATITTTTITPTTVVETASTTTTAMTAPAPARRDGARAVVGPVVTLQASDEDAAPGEIDQAIGRLEPGTVLRMRVEDFPPYTTAHASQCVAALCSNVIDVQFGPDGIATFQYFVTDDFIGASVGGCRLDSTPCSIVVENIDGDGRAEIVTLFHDALPEPGAVRVTPRKDLVAGDALTIDVDGFRPGGRLTVVSCLIGTTRCAKVERAPSLTVAGDGSGTTRVSAPSCPGRFDCELRVRAEGAFSRSAAVVLAFAPVPGADYDPRRLAVGIAIASLLLGAAIYLIRRSDWTAIGEEAAPEIDDAEYADLDALVALMPPEDEDVLTAF